MAAEQDPLSRLAFAEEGDVQEDVPIDDDDDDREPEHAHQGEPHAPLAEPHAPLTEPHAPLTEPRAPLTDDRVTGHEHPAPAAEEHPEQCAPERPACPCPVTASAARRDRVASYSATTQYDQLMGGAYDDSHVFERGGEIEPAAAGARDAPAVAIAVKDPVRKVEASMLPGINGGYVTYRVDTRTALPGFARPEASVRRRFREFVVRRRRGPTT